MGSKTTLLVILLLALSTLAGNAQHHNQVITPQQNDFLPLIRVLASDSLMGRETGETGGLKAGNFIAEYLQSSGLEPFNGSYFQPFSLTRFDVSAANMGLKTDNKALKDSLFRFGEHFSVAPFPGSIEVQADAVFAGYGMISTDSAYNDFARLNIAGKWVVVLEGYPGMADTNAPVWNEVGRAMKQKDEGIQAQKRNALFYKAIGLIVVQTDKELTSSLWLKRIGGMDSRGYEDGYYAFSDAHIHQELPVVGLSAPGAAILEAAFGLVWNELAIHIAHGVPFEAEHSNNVSINLKALINKKHVRARNVMGYIRGADTNTTLVVGGHYDHLGRRADSIYNGADDNASGASAVLSLAAKWKQSGVQPAVNMLFACWDGEEKGLFGSSFFVQKWQQKPQHLMAYLNMDMVSRSDATDSLARVVSVGIAAKDSALVHMVGNVNGKLNPPLVLDIWDVTGHSGSDYGPFAEAGIPVMTFFSGFHNDYHSPRDRFERIDPNKMERVVQLINSCLIQLQNEAIRPATRQD